MSEHNGWLTNATLTQALELLQAAVQSERGRLALQPTQLIVPGWLRRHLLRRPPLTKAGGPRGRKKALARRAAPALWRMMRGSGA